VKYKTCNNACLSSKEYVGRKAYIDYSDLAVENYIECKCAVINNYELKTFYKVIPDPTNKE
jgi:hypothetical protein